MAEPFWENALRWLAISGGGFVLIVDFYMAVSMFRQRAGTRLGTERWYVRAFVLWMATIVLVVGGSSALLISRMGEPIGWPSYTIMTIFITKLCMSYCFWRGWQNRKHVDQEAAAP